MFKLYEGTGRCKGMYRTWNDLTSVMAKRRRRTSGAKSVSSSKKRRAGKGVVLCVVPMSMERKKVMKKRKRSKETEVRQKRILYGNERRFNSGEAA
jgi:hypothetical protein